jgi:hypothetical protein
MANSFNTQILRDGRRNFVIRLTGEIDLTSSDGGTPAHVPDFPVTQLTNIATMNPPCQALRVDRVKYSLPHGSPLDVQLWWQATTNELFWGMAGGDDSDFWNFGGLTNNASPGATGNIMWSTSGANTYTPQSAGTPALTFAVIVECVKLQPQIPL